MVCLDTSVLVALVRKDSQAVQRLTAESNGGAGLSTTIINLCELYAGAFASRDPKKELERVQGLISHLRVLELGVGAARRYGELVSSQGLKKEPIGDFDLMIGCIALEHNENIATRNLKHFGRIPGLIAERW